MKYAEFVLAHYSTSLLELVLQKKKVVFLYSEEYMESDSRTVLETAMEYADMLQAVVADIKKDEDVEIRFKRESVRPVHRKVYRYMKKGKMIPTRQLIIEFLKKLSEQ